MYLCLLEFLEVSLEQFKPDIDSVIIPIFQDLSTKIFSYDIFKMSSQLLTNTINLNNTT
jgi:hypothetical protein